MLSPEQCGGYDADIFAECVDNEPELAETFKLLCIYDFCENFYTFDESNDQNPSGCLFDGKLP